jgi:hypothetical protein
MGDKCGLNPLAQLGIGGQGRELEPDESDEVSQD